MLCGILIAVEQPIKKRRPRKSYTVRDTFTISPKEKDVYHEVFKETVLKNRRCVSDLSLSKLGERTNLHPRTVDEQLKRLVKRRMIEINKKQKTNTICINIGYKEIYNI